MSVTTILSQFSDALSDLTANARDSVAAVQTVDGCCECSGILWRPNAVAVSEQALADAKEYEVTIGGAAAKATLAGRDSGTNVAVLKLERDFAHTARAASIPKTGSLALVLGAAEQGVSARLALVRSVGGAWESRAGGTIDHRIVLDTRIGSEEGGPVLAADGSLLGMSTRGARRETLVIPASTVEKSVAALQAHGSVQRGWLGVALRPVALPEALRPASGQRVGLMVMEVASSSPGAKAGIVAGDILLSAGGVPATRFGHVTRQLGPSTIGKGIEVVLARAGATVTSKVTIEAKPA
jgi:S1-C subfamily serine protease